MKLAHISDCHLGFTRSGWSFLREDVFCAFETAIHEAAELADVILITGDLFHSVKVDIGLLHEAAKTIRSTGLPTVIIGGNHDTSASRGSESPLIMLPELCPNVVLFASGYGVWRYAGLEFHGVPARWLRHWRTPIVPQGESVLMIHGVHPNSPHKPLSDVWLIPQLYEPERFLYVALGDLHEWHQVPAGGRQYYAGSTTYCSTNVWSESPNKGWLLVDEREVQFRPIPQRSWITVRLDLDAGDDLSVLERAVSESKRTSPLQLDPVVRVVIQSVDSQLLREWEISLRKQTLPVAGLHIERRWCRPGRVENTRDGERFDLAKRWAQFVREHKQQLPIGLREDEIVLRGLQALGELDDPERARQVLKQLVEVDDGLDPDGDPFAGGVIRCQ